MSSDIETVSVRIREKAHELGFDLVGIARAEKLQGHGEKLAAWCEAGMNAGMGYLARDIEKRCDPGLLFRGAKSVIVTGLNYYNERKISSDGNPVLSKYAYGSNYHDVITARLDLLLKFIISTCPSATGKAFVDSAPLFEKAWGRMAGLGWPGRHSVLINREAGSFFFLGVLITDLALRYDEPHYEDYCGTCRICIDTCPVGAINEDRTIDARKCIAYLTIESKDAINDIMVEKMEGRIFGCDICQDACPWNKHAVHHHTPEFEPSTELTEMTSAEWTGMSKEKFKRLFARSAIGRKKYEIFNQNVTNVTKRGRK